MQAIYWGQLFFAMATLAMVGHAIVGRFVGRPVAGGLLLASLTPHFIGGIFLALIWVWPGGSPLVYVVAPVLICLPAWFFLCRDGACYDDLKRGVISNALVSLAILLFATLVGYVIWERLSTGHTSHDISVYLAEARELAIQRNIWALPQFEPVPGQITLTHPHLPTWSAYLAQALVFSTDNSGRLLETGFVSGDWQARLAVGFVFFCMLLAILGFGLMMMQPLYAFVAAAIALSAPYWSMLILMMSRDPFRTAPLVALLGIMAACINGQRCRPNGPGVEGDRSNLPMYFIVAVAALASASAHTINLVYLVAIGLAMAAVVLVERSVVNIVFRLGLAILVGILPVFAHYFMYLVEYGHPLGLGMVYLFYSGTPLEVVFSESANWTKKLDVLDSVAAYSKLVGWLPMVGAACSILLLIYRIAIRKRVNYLAPAVAFLACTHLSFVFVPLFSQFGQVSIAGAFTSNLRYSATVVGLSGVSIVSIFAVALPQIFRRYVIGWLATTLLLIVTLSLASYVMLKKWPNVTESWQLENVRLNREVIDQVVEATKLGGNWVVTDYSLVYGVQKTPLFLFSKPLRQLLLAKTAEEVDREIEALCLVMIAVAYPDLIYRGVLTEMPFFRVASSYSGASVVSNYRWTVLRIPLRPINDAGCVTSNKELSEGHDLLY